MTEQPIDTPDELKVGMRNSKPDREAIRGIRASARGILDTTMQLEPTDTDDPEPSQEEVIESLLQGALMSWGGAVKTLGEGRVGGYLVSFGDEAQTDITPLKDYFTPMTDFSVEFPAKSTTYFNHALTAPLKRRLSHQTTLTQDEFGVFAETILDERDKYEAFLLTLAEEGKLGWSSGTAAHLVERERKDSGSHEITRWPLGLDASLTHSPAEPRNGVMPLKSLELPPVEFPEAGEGESAPTETETGDDLPIKSNTTEVIMDITQEQLQSMLTAAATEAIKALPAEKPAVGVNVVKDEADQSFKNAGEFFQAVKAAGIYPQSEDPRLRSLKATGMSEGVPADGGYLLEESYASGLLERMYGTGSLLNMLPTYAVGPNSNSMTFHGVDETSRALGSRWGALRGYWLAEADTITASRPKFRDVVVKLNKVAALVYATDEQLEDSTFLASWLGRTVPNELRFRVEDSVINGDGSGKPLGVLNAPCLVIITQETSQPADTLYYENIVKMWARRWAGVNDYVWLCNQDVMPALDTLSLAVGTGGLPANYITYSADGVMRIKGRPAMEVEYCATLGDVGDIILFSPSSYLALVKGGVQAASSIHVSFAAAETAFRFIYRFGGQPSWDSALTPANGSNTQSPFVVTETR